MAHGGNESDCVCTFQRAFPFCARENDERARFRGRESAREKKKLVKVYRNDTRVSKDVVRERNGETVNEMRCVRKRERERGNAKERELMRVRSERAKRRKRARELARRREKEGDVTR